MKRTFSLSPETREFQAFKKADVADRCINQNDAIIQLVCKLTYLKSISTQNHWIRNLVGIFTNNQAAHFKNGGRFDYDWFFEGRGQMSTKTAQSFIDTIDDKYDDIIPDYCDPDRLINNMDNLRLDIKNAFGKKGKLLEASELRKIIESLDFYDGTQD